MILVDTSVWIDFFAGRELAHVLHLEASITDGENLALCGVILTEVLQGLGDDKTYRRVKSYFKPLIMLPMHEGVFVKAADIYRKLRKAGITIRKSNDCIIAATALEHRCRLLHNDKDFLAIAEYCSLMVIKT